MKRITILILTLGLLVGLAAPPNLIAEKYNIKKYCKELEEEPSFIFENFFTNFKNCVTYYTNQVKEGCKSSWQSLGYKSVKDCIRCCEQQTVSGTPDCLCRIKIPAPKPLP